MRVGRISVVARDVEACHWYDISTPPDPLLRVVDSKLGPSVKNDSLAKRHENWSSLFSAAATRSWLPAETMSGEVRMSLLQ